MVYTAATTCLFTAIRVAIVNFSQMLCPFIAIGQTLETSLGPFEKVEEAMKV